MGCEAARQLATYAFGPETANERSAQWWLKKCYKEGENLEDEYSGQLSEVDSDN